MNRRIIRTVLSVLLIGMYIAGLIAMFARQARLGIYLWVISTLGGIGLLYWIHVMNRREEDAEKIRRGMPYGDPDDPTKPVEPIAPGEKREK